MDTTYFGRTFALMVFMDNTTGLILHHQFIHYETNALYKQGITKVKLSYDIQSISCDGRQGLLGGLDIPTQMC